MNARAVAMPLVGVTCALAAMIVTLAGGPVGGAAVLHLIAAAAWGSTRRRSAPSIPVEAPASAPTPAETIMSEVTPPEFVEDPLLDAVEPANPLDTLESPPLPVPPATPASPAPDPRLEAGIQRASNSLQTVVDALNASLDKLGSEARAHAEQLERLGASMTATESIQPDQSPADIDGIASRIDETMAWFVDLVVGVSKSGITIVHRIEDAMAAMDDVAERVEEVRQVARQTHMLSINASIEAARADATSGAGFDAVASEVRRLSGATDELSDKISETVSRTKTLIVGVKEAATVLAGKDLSTAVGSKDRIRSMLDSLIDAHRSNHAELETLRESATQLVGSTAAATTHLQELDHVRDSLAGLSPEAEPAATAVAPPLTTGETHLF